jgi:hypothetical protein
VQNEESLEIKQVGSSCLKDFLGHDNPEKIAKLAELLGYADESARGYTHSTGDDKRYIPLDVYLGYVAREVRVNAFYVTRSRAEEYSIPSTATVAYQAMTRDHIDSGDYISLTANDISITQLAINWAKGLGADGSQLNDFQHSVKTIAASGMIEHRSIGYAASIVNSYQRMVGRKEELANNPKPVSEHLGVVGEMLTVSVTVSAIYEIDTQFGPSILFKMLTDDGSHVTVFSPKTLAEVGERFTLQGRVKKHAEYKGSKQTIVNRPKVIQTK